MSGWRCLKGWRKLGQLSGAQLSRGQLSKGKHGARCGFVAEAVVLGKSGGKDVASGVAYKDKGVEKLVGSSVRVD
jgi:hypothetical protein